MYGDRMAAPFGVYSCFEPLANYEKRLFINYLHLDNQLFDADSSVEKDIQQISFDSISEFSRKRCSASKSLIFWSKSLPLKGR